VSAPPVIVATATVMDGLVLRWYRTTDDWNDRTAAVSASRNGVCIHTVYLHQVPPGWLEDANRAWQLIASGRVAQARREMATHEPTRLIGGELRPAAAPAESTQDGEQR